MGSLDALELLHEHRPSLVGITLAHQPRRQEENHRRRTEPPACLTVRYRSRNAFFWTERKPIDLWMDLLLCLDAEMVVDLSLGSGVAARAAMHSNIEYIGCCSNETHAMWMSNVLDREQCAFIGGQDPK